MFDPLTSNPGLWATFLQALRDAAGAAKAADEAAETTEADAPGHHVSDACGEMRTLVHLAESLPDADPNLFHQSALGIGGHYCSLGHGVWSRVFQGCMLYADVVGGRRPYWEYGVGQWLGLQAPWGPWDPGPQPPPPVLEPGPPQGYPQPGGWVGSTPEILDHALHIGTYVGAAAAGGVIGNRVDAGVVAAVKRAFRAMRRRLPGGRRAGPSMSRDEAIESASSAVYGHGYLGGTCVPVRADREADCWIVHCRAVRPGTGEDLIRVRVPFAGSASPSILLVNCGPA